MFNLSGMVFVSLILSLLFFCAQSSAAEPDQGAWRKLLHYQTTVWGTERSQMTAPEFFLSKDGPTSSSRELQTNLEAYKTDPLYSCVFPARANWISKNFQLPEKKCPDVELWKQKIDAKSVALVHVSQFVSNPSSAFGHGFFLFRSDHRPLNLHSAFNNAAEVPEDVGLWAYLTKGIFGGFPGIYTIEPFYVKIQEYNHIENRDMWVYDLNLSPDEIEQLLNHLWELTNQGSEPYYFFNRNCSVNIFNALAAVTKLDFLDQLYVLPIEAIQKSQSRVKEKIYLPSLREKIAQRKARLPSSQNPQIDQAEIELEIFEFKKSKNGGKLSDEDAKSYATRLLQRSKLGPNPHPLDFSSPPPPDGAMPTWRWAVGGKRQDDSNLITYSGAFFHHSLIQRPDGFLPNSEIIAGKFDVFQDAQNRMSFDEITLVRMMSLPTSQDFDPQQSFRVSLGFGSKRDCPNCLHTTGEGALGKSFSLGSLNVAYGMLGALTEEDQIFLPEGVLGVAVHFPKLIVNLEYQRLQDLSNHQLTEDRGSLTAGASISKNMDLQMQAQSTRRGPTYSLSIGCAF